MIVTIVAPPKHHQICTAHLQRELISLTQKYPMQTWTMKFNDLILGSLKLAKRYKQVPKKEFDQIFLKLDKLLKLKINPK